MVLLVLAVREDHDANRGEDEQDAGRRGDDHAGAVDLELGVQHEVGDLEVAPGGVCEEHAAEQDGADSKDHAHAAPDAREGHAEADEREAGPDPGEEGSLGGEERAGGVEELGGVCRHLRRETRCAGVAPRGTAWSLRSCLTLYAWSCPALPSVRSAL